MCHSHITPTNAITEPIAAGIRRLGAATARCGTLTMRRMRGPKPSTAVSHGLDSTMSGAATTSKRTC